MNGDSAAITCSMEMRQKPHHPLSFLGRRAVAPRPLSESTDFFDTDNEAWDDDYSTKQSLETVSQRDTSDVVPRSFCQLDNGSVSTASSPSSLKTPHSGGLDAFEFHFEDKPIRGPSGPHLFSVSPHIARDTDSFEEFELFAEMSLEEMAKIAAPTVGAKEPPREEVTKARPFSSLNKAVAELDETQVRDWTPHQVANWMREAGFETSVVDKFVKHDISGAVLLDLQFEDLKELDITSYGKRHRVMSSIQHLRNSSMISIDATLSRSNSKLE